MKEIPSNIRKEILSEIMEFCGATGISPWLFGKRVINNGKLVSRLQNGKGLWSDSIDIIRNYISSHGDR